MRRFKTLFVALLLFVSVSQIGATGFAPNMFVAQKQLNQPSSAQITTQKTTTSASLATPQKEATTDKEHAKEPFRFSEKKLKPELSDQNIELIDVDSLVSVLCKSLLQWILVYVTSLV